MLRRELLKSVGFGMTAGLGLSALQAVLPEIANAAEKPNDKVKSGNPELNAVLRTAMECVKNGNVCLAHCQRELATGNKSLAECQKNVMNMTALCDALTKLAAYNSADETHLKAFVKVCSSFCADCASACEKHASHHAECKACYDSCKECGSACDKYTA